MEDEVHVVGQEDEVRQVVFDELEAVVACEVREVGDVARDEIVHADDTVALSEEPVGEVVARKGAYVVVEKTP